MDGMRFTHTLTQCRIFHRQRIKIDARQCKYANDLIHNSTKSNIPAFYRRQTKRTTQVQCKRRANFCELVLRESWVLWSHKGIEYIHQISIDFHFTILLDAFDDNGARILGMRC